jgi:hypothetical protein
MTVNLSNLFSRPSSSSFHVDKSLAPVPGLISTARSHSRHLEFPNHPTLERQTTWHLFSDLAQRRSFRPRPSHPSRQKLPLKRDLRRSPRSPLSRRHSPNPWRPQESNPPSKNAPKSTRHRSTSRWPSKSTWISTATSPKSPRKTKSTESILSNPQLQTT